MPFNGKMVSSTMKNGDDLMIHEKGCSMIEIFIEKPSKMEDFLNVGIIWSIKHTPFWKHKHWRIEYDFLPSTMVIPLGSILVLIRSDIIKKRDHWKIIG
jgi:hypothetical protein